MATWARWMAVVTALAVVGWVWSIGLLGAGAAVACATASLLVLLLPASPARRRKGALQYIEMCKQPVGSP